MRCIVCKLYMWVCCLSGCYEYADVRGLHKDAVLEWSDIVELARQSTVRHTLHWHTQRTRCEAKPY